MRHEIGAPTRRLSPQARRIVERLADMACPPEVRQQGLTSALLGEFEALFDTWPAGLRWLVRLGLSALNQGARLYPPARGRRFVALADGPAEAYFLAALSARRGGLGAALQRIKGLVVFCYYELPEVKDQLGYRPEPYMAAVSRRRLETYGAQIRAAEMAVLAVSPGPADGGTPPDPGAGPP
jgi:hypothetical protein